MCDSVEKARSRLIEGAYTCVLLHNGEEYHSFERGVKPLIDLLKTEKTFVGSVAADKTVGAGAAHLYVLLGTKALWANIISESALRVLKDNGIEVSYGECVPYIMNRKGDGTCPIESAVAEAKSSADAYLLILSALEDLRKKQDRSFAVAAFKALADDNRLEIMEMLKERERCGCELLASLNIGQSTLSHHMHVLCEAGLVCARKAGKWMHYSISSDGVQMLHRISCGYNKVNL